MIVAVDIGNTTVEFATMDQGTVIKKYLVPSKKFRLQDLDDKLEQALGIKLENVLVIISSVVPPVINILQYYLKKKFKANVHVLNYNHFDGMVTRKTGTLQGTGLDILCKAAWVYNVIKQDTLIVDSGTATVMQHVLQDGTIDGASISPGLGTLMVSLHQQTALLPLYTVQEKELLLGDNTQDAVQGGVFWGYIGLIEKTIEKAKQEKSCQSIYATGGNFKLIKDKVKAVATYNPHIIFEGIYSIYENKKDQFKVKET